MKLNKVINNKRQLMFLLVFALIFIRYCYYGFEYYYQLDDYSQYYNYYNRGITTIAQCAEIGFLGARPLAGLADILLWSKLFPVMIAGTAIISAMYAASACLFQWVWERHFGTGIIFVVVYTLLPLGFEGTYWMGAATRIVTSLFFTAAALYFFEKWCDGGRLRNLILYAVAQLISFGFYEQILVLSFTSVVIAALLYFKSNRRRSLWGLLSLLNAAVFFIFLAYFSNSAIYGSRMEVILPTTIYYFKTFLPNLLDQIFSAFIGGGFFTFFKGFVRGIIIFISKPNMLYLICILALCALLFLFIKRSEHEAKNTRIAVLVGLALAIAPLAPFFIVASTWFSLRGTVASFCGIALLADTAFNQLTKNARSRQTLTAGAAAVFSLYCCIASISEIHDYKETTENDMKAVSAIADRVVEDGYLDSEFKIGILNLDSTYLEDQNYPYHEHINGVTESDWALADALEYYLDGHRMTITPLHSEPMYEPWNCEQRRLGNFDILYLYEDGSLTQVTIKSTGNESYELYGEDGGYLGYTWEEDNFGYMVLNDSLA